MSRRHEPDTQLPTVEFIDNGASNLMGSDPPNFATGSQTGEVDEIDPQDRPISNTILTVAAVVTAVGLLLLLSTVGNEPPEVAAPTTTEAPSTTTTTERTTTTIPITREERLESIGVLLGPGPGLEWQPVDATIGRPSFVWIDDRFVSDDGKNELQVGLTGGRASSEVSSSPLIEFPGYRLQNWGGDRLLVPEDELVDHAFILRPDAEPLRVDLPTDDEAPASDLTRAQTWVQGSVVGKRFVATIAHYVEIDHAALGERLGVDLSDAMYIEIGFDRLTPHFQNDSSEPILFDETDLTATELDQLRRSNGGGGPEQMVSIDLETSGVSSVDLPDLRWFNAPLRRSDEGVTVLWTDSSNRSWKSTSTDGLDWSTTEVGSTGWMVSTGSQLLDLTPSSQIRRSVDDGETWQSTRSPRRETQPTAADDVIILGRSWNQFEPRTEVQVATDSPEYELVMIAPGPEFEVRAASGEVILNGYFWDEANGGVWDQDTGEHVLTDPSTGDELLRVSEAAVSVARAQANPMTEVELTRWPADQEHPEWQLASPVELFGAGALTVDFVAGDGQILAVVTAVDGYRLFIADTAAP